MERAEAPLGAIRWKKVGGGAFHFNRRVIKPGQIFMARVDDIPKAFRDTCIPLDDIKEPVEVPLNLVKHVYTVVPRGKSKSLFDVVTDKGKKLNDKTLTKEEATKLVEELNR